MRCVVRADDHVASRGWPPRWPTRLEPSAPAAVARMNGIELIPVEGLAEIAARARTSPG